MKSLLALGATAALISAATTYAGDRQHEEDCCNETIEVNLFLDIPCVCEVSLTGGVTYNLANVQARQALGSNILAECNTAGGVEVNIWSEYDGNLVILPGELDPIPYGITIGNTTLGNTKLSTTPMLLAWNNDPHPVGVTLQAAGPFMAGLHQDTVYIEVVPVF